MQSQHVLPCPTWPPVIRIGSLNPAWTQTAHLVPGGVAPGSTATVEVDAEAERGSDWVGCVKDGQIAGRGTRAAAKTSRSVSNLGITMASRYTKTVLVGPSPLT